MPDASRRGSKTEVHPARFVVPALIGSAVFLGPVITEERQTVVFGLVTDVLKAMLGGGIDLALLLVVGVAALGALAFRLFSASGDPEALVSKVFRTSWPWVFLRLCGFVVVLCVYLDAGPGILRLPDTGITVIKDIAQNVLVIYFGGLLLMPLLTEYGLMEFAGTLCRRPFKALFLLPGRAAIDALTSIAAASAIGALVTISQYQRGYYTAREACTIACNFSLVSIPFCLLVAQVSRVDHIFFSWFLSVLIACVICAVILARVPPLSRVANTAMIELPVSDADSEVKSASGIRRAWHAALARAESGPGPRAYVTGALQAFAINSAGVIGPSIAIATLASILLFHSPVITGLGWPIAWLLDSASVADSAAIASGMLVGFGDQFMPALVASKIDSELWRFVLAGLSVSQIIFMAEFGLLVLRSPLPIGFGTLALLFLLRTLITLPILFTLGLFFT